MKTKFLNVKHASKEVEFVWCLMPFHLYFFLKKYVFPSVKTLFEIKSYAGSAAPGARFFHVSPLNFHTILRGGEMGSHPRDRGYNHWVDQLGLSCYSVPPTYFQQYAVLNMQIRDLLRNHSCNSWEQWFTRYGERTEQWKPSISSVGSKSTGCRKFKEIVRLTKIWSAYYYHHVLLF